MEHWKGIICKIVSTYTIWDLNCVRYTVLCAWFTAHSLCNFTFKLSDGIFCPSHLKFQCSVIDIVLSRCWQGIVCSSFQQEERITAFNQGEVAEKDLDVSWQDSWSLSKRSDKLLAICSETDTPQSLLWRSPSASPGKHCYKCQGNGENKTSSVACNNE